MKKLRIIFSMLAVLFFTAQKAEAQYYFFDDDYYDNPWVFEVGGSVNAMNCLTDIGGKKVIVNFVGSK